MRRLFLIIAILTVLILVVTLFQSRRANHKDFIILFGNVDVRQVDIGFRVSGLITAVNFEEGDQVHAGDLIAVLDKQPFSDQVQVAKANVESIQASLKNAEKLLQRRQNLIASGSVSQEDLDTAESNREVLTANLQQAKASVAVAQSNLEDTEAFAPTEATVLTRVREPGAVVNIGDPVCTLSITSPVWIRAFVNEPELGIIYPGMEAEILTDIEGGRVYHGRIGFISPVAEFTPKTVETTQLRTDLVYRLRIYAENPDRGLRQGMPVTVRLRLQEKQ